MKKVDIITREELHLGWFIRKTRKGETLIGNRALFPIRKSGALVGRDYGDVCYLPHRLNLNTGDVDVFKGDFLVLGLDPNIKIPLFLNEQ